MKKRGTFKFEFDLGDDFQLDKIIAQIQHQVIEAALLKNKGYARLTAEALGLKRTTFRHRLEYLKRKFGLETTYARRRKPRKVAA